MCCTATAELLIRLGSVSISQSMCVPLQMHRLLIKANINSLWRWNCNGLLAPLLRGRYKQDKRGNQTGPPQTSQGCRDANISCVNPALAFAGCLALRFWKSPLCQGGADIQRWMYFFSRSYTSPSAALENVLLEVRQSACVFLKPTPVRTDWAMWSRDWINI